MTWHASRALICLGDIARKLGLTRHLSRLRGSEKYERAFDQALFSTLLHNDIVRDVDAGVGYYTKRLTEQASDAVHRITLADGTVDSFGLPLARICWQVCASDIERFHAIGALAVERWHAGPLALHARLRPRPEEDVAAGLEAGGGIYHPAGTTRIGPTAETGVVDNRLNVHGVHGLRALATSVFPTVGGSSPSLCLIQMALRMADDIAVESRLAPVQLGLNLNNSKSIQSNHANLS